MKKYEKNFRVDYDNLMENQQAFYLRKEQANQHFMSFWSIEKNFNISIQLLMQMSTIDMKIDAEKREEKSIYDESIRFAIDTIFKKYGYESKGLLGFEQVEAMIRDTFFLMGRKTQGLQEKVRVLIESLDLDGDGKISKEEMFLAFKKMSSQ